MPESAVESRRRLLSAIGVTSPSAHSMESSMESRANPQRQPTMVDNATPLLPYGSPDASSELTPTDIAVLDEPSSTEGQPSTNDRQSDHSSENLDEVNMEELTLGDLIRLREKAESEVNEEQVLHFTIAKAVKQFGDKANEAITAE
eukprot:scaffold16415_cov1829-Ochromonas_danica.AAC.1